MDKKKWIRHLPLYILELVVLAAAIGALYFVMHATKAQKQQIKEGDIAVNEEIRQQFQNDTEEDQEQDPQKPNLPRNNRSTMIILARQEILSRCVQSHPCGWTRVI